MGVNFNIFTARSREVATVQGPIQPQEPTVVERERPGRTVQVARRVQDTFEAAPVKRDDLPKLFVPDAPGAKELPRMEDPDAAPVNEAAEAQAEKGWETNEDAVAQQTETGCGEASLAYLNKASRKDEPHRSADQELKEVRAKASEINQPKTTEKKVDVNLKDGATAEEMGVVLGEMGIDVTEGFEKYDANAISAALKRGEFGLALVDSNAILNSALPAHKQRKEPGELHWVTIDGFNSGRNKKDASDDKYRVKDPVNGEYWVKAKDLEKAIEQGRQSHGGGGVLAVEKRKDVDTREQRESLAESNRHRTHGLGKGNGRGSRRLSVGESS
ncbi:hypothetical protein [Pyxidicoccus sp. MSG2]|uniref:hypothetical protein n=1 Tax=Pyxidicoccus sp. MSG2 TaxID=2996790 RepID=UPI00226F73D5|nr:hypothetical protein [Pyxidicoccus sp. MSG2]MCY1019647.1 hypothetical protein [Pyxidicoccus sp. MSG2]